MKHPSIKATALAETYPGQRGSGAPTDLGARISALCVMAIAISLNTPHISIPSLDSALMNQKSRHPASEPALGIIEFFFSDGVETRDDCIYNYMRRPDNGDCQEQADNRYHRW